ncbi:MAG: hypothetical protein WC509_08335 [Candidatus Izemoplasmatales bacterium]
MIDENFLLEIKHNIGFRPVFHDDYIPSFVMDSDNLVMKFQILKEHARNFTNVDFNKDVLFTVIFRKIQDLLFETDGFCNDVTCLIFDFSIKKKEERYHVEIEPSCGLYMNFTAESFEITR